MKHNIASLISFIFHPVLLFLLMPFLIVYHDTGNSLYALKWGVYSAIFVVIGIFFILYGKRRGVFSDFDLSNQQERKKFYIFITLLGALYLIIALYFKGIFFPMSIIVLGIMLGIALFEGVNYFLKASIHVGVAVAYTISLGFIYGLPLFLLSLPITPLVIWSRLTLKRHTPKEAFVGGILGIVVTLGTIFLAHVVYGN